MPTKLRWTVCFPIPTIQSLYPTPFSPLAGLPTLEHVLGHPICGASWEGYCIEQGNGEIHAIEIKRTLSPKLTPGLVESMQTLGAHRGFLVIPEGTAYSL